MQEYPLHSVKQDPVTGSVAVRRDTNSPEDPAAWGVMSPVTGGSYASTSQVAEWEDRT